MSRFSVYLVAAASLPTLAACGGSDRAPTSVVATRRALDAVSIAPGGTASVAVGDTARFSAVVSQPAGAPAATLTWRVSDARVATVSRDGVLTAIAPGAFSLIAVASTPSSGVFKADSMVSTVFITSLPPSLTSLEVQPGLLSTSVGSQVAFAPQVVAASSAVQVTWAYQLQQALGSVDGNGLITTSWPGTTQLRIAVTGTAPGYQTTTLVALRTLNVLPTPGITRLDVPASITVPEGGTVRIPVTLEQPRGALRATVNGESAAANVATVAGEDPEWTITGVKAGTTNVTFRAVFPESAGFFSISRVATTTVTVVAR
jgi:hypothetical protein